jgi:hypothetical protein
MSQHYIAIWQAKNQDKETKVPDKDKIIYSQVHSSREAAIDDLDIIFDLEYDTKRLLRKRGVAKISIRDKDDATIWAMGCCCLDPKRHNYTEEE